MLDESRKIEIFESLIPQLLQKLNNISDRTAALNLVARELDAGLETYDWVGFYLVDPLKERELVLGPYIGEETDHVRIAFGQGVCGQAAETERTFVIDDVNQEGNYLACSLDVKSEIVVPIFSNGKIVGELDIDSHQVAAFDSIDQRYLEKICVALASFF